jgi:hypothetical protein
MVSPKTAQLQPGVRSTVHESTDSIPFGSWAGRVQIVNANRMGKKARGGGFGEPNTASRKLKIAWMAKDIIAKSPIRGALAGQALVDHA